MSYVRSYQFARSLILLILGLPFIFGVFSNVRPAVPEQVLIQSQPQFESIDSQNLSPLFSEIPMGKSEQTGKSA